MAQQPNQNPALPGVPPANLAAVQQADRALREVLTRALSFASGNYPMGVQHAEAVVNAAYTGQAAAQPAPGQPIAPAQLNHILQQLLQGQQQQQQLLQLVVQGQQLGQQSSDAFQRNVRRRHHNTGAAITGAPLVPLEIECVADPNVALLVLPGGPQPAAGVARLAPGAVSAVFPGTAAAILQLPSAGIARLAAEYNTDFGIQQGDNVTTRRRKLETWATVG